MNNSPDGSFECRSAAILFEYRDGELVDLFATFCNDEQLRTTILVDNLARLYGRSAVPACMRAALPGAGPPPRR
jgi:hypothetical protein